MSEQKVIPPLIVIADGGFTTELRQALKRFAANLYDTIYFEVYVTDWPSIEARHAGEQFRWRWQRDVIEPLVAGYQFAIRSIMHAGSNPEKLNRALDQLGYLFEKRIGWEERGDYDEATPLAQQTIDQIFADMDKERR